MKTEPARFCVRRFRPDEFGDKIRSGGGKIKPGREDSSDCPKSSSDCPIAPGADDPHSVMILSLIVESVRPRHFFSGWTGQNQTTMKMPTKVIGRLKAKLRDSGTSSM